MTRRLLDPARRAEPYTSWFRTWESRASVRTRPTRNYDSRPAGTIYFPPELAPETAHPLVSSRGPEAVDIVLLQRLYQYLDFTSELETTTVVPITTQIARLRCGFGVPPAMQEDAFKIITDEAWHAQFSDSLIRSIRRDTGIAPLRHAHHFHTRLEQIMARAGDLQGAAEMSSVICSETLISGFLAKLPNDSRLAPAVRDTVRDHAADEGRHHAYFRAALDHFWPVLSASERRVIGPLLAETILAFLEPDRSRLLSNVMTIGLEFDEAQQVIDDAYPAAAVRTDCAIAARSTVRYLANSGVLEDPRTYDAFVERGLVTSDDPGAV